MSDPNYVDESSTGWRWNIPNVLAAFRLAGSFVLVGLAIWGIRQPFVWLLMALLLSDWLDGKLAILLRQRTVFGARLDSLADTSMYAALLFGTLWLKLDFVRREWRWIAAAVASYLLTSVAGLVKYQRLPSYHTRAAKTSWLLVGISAIIVFADGPAWPFRLAMTFVVLTNLEATAMTRILSRFHTDVPSLFHAWRLHRVDRQLVRSQSLHNPMRGEGKEAEQDKPEHQLPRE